MELAKSISDFYLVILNDPRISPVHISLYMAFLELWLQQGHALPIEVFSRQAMPLAKISGIATYYKTVKELHEFGYIRYVASFNQYQGSLIYIDKIEINESKK